MGKLELVVVAGCNAAGKSSFIRSHFSSLEECEVIMTDVYKSRTREVFKQALQTNKNIVLETVFNDSSIKDWVDEARNLGYLTSLIVLFLDTIYDSVNRVAYRTLEQGGLIVSGNNVRLNFNESFKNIAMYFFYFDQSDFIYTGVKDENSMIMSFQKAILISYTSNNLQYPQKFADYAYGRQRLNDKAYHIIRTNQNHYLSEQ
jgi:predicted ABC-type ATPase